MYWIVLTDTNSGDKWYWTGAAWADYAGMVPSQVGFVSDFAVDAIPVTFGLDITPFDPSTYELVVYTRDRSGNVGLSDVKTIVLQEVVTDHIFSENLAHITAIEVMNEHDDNGGEWLASGRPGTPNFYLSVPDYYTSQDHIEIKITVNNRSFLRSTDAVKLDLSPLGLGVVWFNANAFGADNSVVHTISNADLRSLGTDKQGTWNVGTPGGMNLGVYAYSIYTDSNLDEQVHESAATSTDAFNLVVPPAPVWPDLGATELTLGDTHISPGSYGNVYHAVNNPATDGVLDFTTIDIAVPSSSEPLSWVLTVKNPVNTRTRRWSGSLAPGATHNATYNFFGRDNDLNLLVGAIEEQELEVKLVVTPSSLADPGYADPPAPLTVTLPLVVDNINPKLVNGNGVTVSPTTVVDLGFIPVVSGLARTMNFVVYTSEVMETAFGWSALVINADGNQIVAPGNPDPVAATVSVASDLSANGVYAYELAV
ncbi:MAG: hypothetical protein U1C33_03685, partial [Candidatus Cloacimonadaceae bacterium]|nr:hypothetical protein [Candidatus Cloacimonadaceae bacterium]